MKQLFRFIFVLFATIIFFSCSEKEDNIPIEEDQYYVKYVAYVRSYTGPWSPYLNSVTVKTERGEDTFATKGVENWVKTIGPVNRGFKAEIEAYGGPYLYVEIHVCVGENGAFECKKSGGNYYDGGLYSSKRAYASFKID
ncbi:hypothetical protein [uncultured Alistipes sp.]|uniref:hypothetical protein n=1 Tax=uncultured Alistipes sp. TaxID=538949 RepID=UPI0032B23202